jgi:hypothetical protein
MLLLAPLDIAVDLSDIPVGEPVTVSVTAEASVVGRLTGESFSAISLEGEVVTAGLTSGDVLAEIAEIVPAPAACGSSPGILAFDSGTYFAVEGAGPALDVLICDRDRKWSGAVRRQLRDAGIRVVLTPARAPNANAYAERFVRSIKEEYLDRLIPIGERHFRRALTEYVAHYHGERNHQGLDNCLISGPPVIRMTSRVRRHGRLGGLLNFYERAA